MTRRQWTHSTVDNTEKRVAFLRRNPAYFEKPEDMALEFAEVLAFLSREGTHAFGARTGTVEGALRKLLQSLGLSGQLEHMTWPDRRI